jgi:hypothetical protein
MIASASNIRAAIGAKKLALVGIGVGTRVGIGFLVGLTVILVGVPVVVEEGETKGAVLEAMSLGELVGGTGLASEEGKVVLLGPEGELEVEGPISEGVGEASEGVRAGEVALEEPLNPESKWFDSNNTHKKGVSTLRDYQC